MNPSFTTQAQVRAAFWQGWPKGTYVRGKKQDGYSATVRSEFVEFVDMLARDGHTAEKLAQKVTL